MSSPLRFPPRVNPLLLHEAERRMSLNEGWRFRLDPDDRGLDERWYASPDLFVDRIDVPGCWQGQGFGGDGKEMVWDFRLEARTLRATYTGTGWYCRRLHLPDAWKERRLFLNFGGVHPSAQVWLNGKLLGESHRPFVPFSFEVTETMIKDGPNVLAVRVHEQDRIMGLAYSWQGNWSGLYRGVELTATGAARLGGVAIHPDVEEEKLRLTATVDGFDPKADLVLRVAGWRGDRSTAVTREVNVAAADVQTVLKVPSPALWSPESPNLYTVEVTLLLDGKVVDALVERTGFVKLSTEGKFFLINDEPYYMRGTGEFQPFPETGSPDTDRARLRRKLATLREYGYNYVRCQSYVPAPEYYDVADEVGLIVQSEMGTLGAWGSHNQWHVYAWPQPEPEHRAALKDQWDDVVLRDVNHPSATIYCMSNELGQSTNYPRMAWQCYRDTKALKPSSMVIWTDGGYSPDLPGDFVNAEADVDERCDKPVIQHEFRWWSSFPDVTLAGKYSGAMRPYAAEIAMDAASRHGIAHVLPQAAKNSQRVQFVEAKAKIEECRRANARLAGICHFNAMDTNPSPQGIIDEFYGRKHADSQTWLQTNGDTVLLCDLDFDRRVYASGDVMTCHVFVSDFSHPPLREPEITWEAAIGHITVGRGHLRPDHEPFRTYDAGEIRIRVPDVDRPEAVVLTAWIMEMGRMFENRWDLWFFPDESPLPDRVGVHGEPADSWLTGVQIPMPGGKPKEPRVLLAERLDDELISFMEEGGRVILAASEGLVRPFGGKLGLNTGRYFFTPPANYPPYEDGHNATIISQHPLFGEMKHEGFADLHFYRMLGESPPLALEPLGLNDADPVLRVIHSYPVGRSLGYLVERSFGKGGIILCALDLNQEWPEARYLLSSMCAYAAGKDFRPADAISKETLEHTAACTTWDTETE